MEVFVSYHLWRESNELYLVVMFSLIFALLTLKQSMCVQLYQFTLIYLCSKTLLSMVLFAKKKQKLTTKEICYLWQLVVG